MNRDAVVTAVIALLAVLSIALGAATLDPIETGGGFGPSGGDDSGLGGADSFQPGGPPQRNASSGGGGGSLPPLIGRLLLAVAVVAGLIGLYGLYRRYTAREIVGIVVGVAIVAAVLYTLIQFIAGFDLQPGNGLLGSGDRKLPGSGGGGGLGGENSGMLPATPPLIVLAAFGLLLVGGAIVALRSTRGGDDPTTEPEVEPTEDTEVAAIGRAAGRAADRIDDDDADTGNEVYRAWEEMTDHLDVANPQASTPGEFATAADDAGMSREDVSRLTDLFRGTRYGGRAITDERESRAVAALRRIEEEYAAADDSTGTTAVEDGGSTDGDRGARR